MPIPQAQYVATGDILPCRFITDDGDFGAKQAGANANVIGISMEGTTMPAIDGMTNGSCIYAARTGQPVRYWGMGQIGGVTAATTFTAGTYLVADAEGKATPAVAGTSENIGAQALHACTQAGQKIRVLVLPHGAKAPA